MLAHILGRLPCSKKTPKKIGNSMLAQRRYRMKIRKTENICRIINCPTKFAKIGTNSQIVTLFVYYIITARSNLQKRQLHYITKREKFRKTAIRCRNSGRNYVSATPQAGALRHIQMAWPNQRANVSDVPRDMKRA